MHDGVTISPFLYSIKLITPSSSLNVSARPFYLFQLGLNRFVV